MQRPAGRPDWIGEREQKDWPPARRLLCWLTEPGRKHKGSRKSGFSMNAAGKITIPMPDSWTAPALLLFVLAVMAGCANPMGVALHPVENQAPALKPGVHSVKTVDVAPAPAKEIQPDYPPELRALVSGKAVVLFTVRADGSVTEASIVKADDVLFGESAVTAVLKSRFHPAQIHGAPVDCRMTLPFFFSNPQGYQQLDSSATAPPPDFPEGVLHPGNNDFNGPDSQSRQVERR
jgi:TonB family protein